MDNILNTLGGKDLDLGVTLHSVLQMSIPEIEQPHNLLLIKEISEYFSNEPSGSSQILSLVARNRGKMPNMEYLAGYVQLNKQLRDLRGKTKELEKHLAAYE